MGYYLTNRGNIIDDNRILIPMIEDNPLYKEYLAFLKDKGTVENTDLYSNEELEQIYKESIPQTASKMRFFLALYNIGVTRAMIYDAINQIEDAYLKEIILIKFDLSQEFDRYDEHLNMMANSFGITQRQLDELFVDANSM
jgi:hypothetical protein